MTWDEHDRAWSEARREPGQAAHWHMQAARKRVASGRLALAETRAADPERKWFVAGVFKFQPVPKNDCSPQCSVPCSEMQSEPQPRIHRTVRALRWPAGAGAVVALSGFRYRH